MKNPLKAVAATATKAKLSVIKKIHDKTEYLLTTTTSERKAARKESRRNMFRRVRNGMGNFRPFWFIGGSEEAVESK